jgi:hypothetical protein
MYIDRCVIIDGVHYGQPDCAHTKVEDETGEVLPLGWTVQQRGLTEEQENDRK